MESLVFEPVAQLWVVALIVAALGGLLMLRPDFGQLTPRRWLTLLLLRCAIIGLTLVALLRPGCVMQIEKPQTGVVNVYLDLTRSMQLPHRATGPTRYQAMRQIIDQNRSLLEKLETNNVRVRWFGFDNQISELDLNEWIRDESETPEGEETDIGSSLDAGLTLVRNQRLLAVVLISDGVQNAVDPQTDLNEAVNAINDVQVPLFAVPLGQADASSQLADLSIENLADQYSIRVENRLQVTATLSSRGFAGERIPVQLILIDGDQEEVVDTVRVPIRQGIEQQRVTLNYTADRVGQFQLLVRAQPQPTETATANNQLPSFLNVENEGVNVLYIYGNLLWEQKYIRAALQSDNLIRVDPVPVDRRIRQPVDLTSQLGDPRYDVIILADVDSRLLYQETFQEENIQVLTERIAQGTGFMMLGGEHSFGPGLYHSNPLADYLPVVMEPFERQEFDEPVREDLHIQGPIELRPTDSHFVTRLGPGADGGNVWDELPPLDIANRFAAIKPSARVLLQSEAGEPILVASSVGGRVLAFAGDSTWKWRRLYSAEIHKRFWRQIILWLAGQDGLVGDDIWIAMPQRRFQLGQAASFTTGLNSLTGEPTGSASLQATLIAPNGTRRELALSADADDFVGNIRRERLKSPGLYAIEVVGQRDQETLGPARTEFVVFDNDNEKAVTSANPELLDRLATQTSQWGGRVVQPESFGELLQSISELAPENRIEIPRRWKLGETWQDATAFLLGFVGLLTIEWFLRKKWGLV